MEAMTMQDDYEAQRKARNAERIQREFKETPEQKFKRLHEDIDVLLDKAAGDLVVWVGTLDPTDYEDINRMRQAKDMAKALVALMGTEASVIEDVLDDIRDAKEA